MNFIRRAIAALARLFRREGTSTTPSTAPGQSAGVAIVPPVEVQEVTQEVAPAVPVSDRHQLPPDVQAEREKFVQQLLNPNAGAESTEQTLASGNVKQAIAMLRRTCPRLVVKADTTIAEVQFDAGRQSVIDILERLHSRGRV